MEEGSGSHGLEYSELVSRVLAGEREASELLALKLMPVIQRRIADVLRRKRPQASRNDLLDYVQRVLECLWDRNFRVLRSWDPEIGDLEPFIAIVAERLTLSILRSGRLSAWREDPTENEDFAGRTDSGVDIERLVMNRELLEILIDRLCEELSPTHLQLFNALFVDERKVEEVSREFRMTPAAIYSWKNRVRNMVRSLLSELVGEGAPVEEKA